ncbi:hypothetical protein [Vulcanisaeta distributa]|uniref:hypothetical protein n=1 Tax=Vulcanisaeta distributa TaxID=164451 RepID=UPI0006CFFC57|nr:hypothetical protein [Vulcanisaeta distributa]
MYCGWTRPHVINVIRARDYGRDLGRLIFIAEEVMMRVYAKLVIETCSKLGLGIEEVRGGIVKDEEVHEELLKNILSNVTAAH